MDYLTYHLESAKIRDIDPANDCLSYVANRFELNMEQRYWLAFLYSTCYCGPTVYYIYNEFPDFENVNVARLQRWWKSNKQKCVFQSDRLRIKTSDQFVPTFESYKKFIGGRTQQEKFRGYIAPLPDWTYKGIYEPIQLIRNVGRFTAFIYLEMLHVLTDFKNDPDTIDWKNADNCRKGLCKAVGVEDSPKNTSQFLDKKLWEFVQKVKAKNCSHYSVFNLETTLCAFEKFNKGQRYIGYYIERQLNEIDKMVGLVTEGVNWDVLYQFRKETYKHIER